MTILSKVSLMAVLAAVAANAQLVQKKAPTAADTVNLGNRKGPSVYYSAKLQRTIGL